MYNVYCTIDASISYPKEPSQLVLQLNLPTRLTLRRVLRLLTTPLTLTNTEAPIFQLPPPRPDIRRRIHVRDEEFLSGGDGALRYHGDALDVRWVEMTDGGVGGAVVVQVGVEDVEAAH